MQRLEAVLKIHFALLAALGGLLLGFSDPQGSLPVIAVFSSLFAFVFVDWLKLFALPPLLGYIAMGLIAAYCISDFVPLSPANDRQLFAVAQLLVLVQAVLMLQKKSRRTFEQIGIFCLLEVVVSAVFNQALMFAVLLLPIGLLGLSAMVLLHVYSVSQSLSAAPAESGQAGATGALASGTGGTGVWIQVSSPSTLRALAAVGLRLPRPVLLSIAPAVLLVGLTFFYAIPRIVESDGMGLGASPQVGFSDTVTLNQIGSLQQNKTLVMRVQLRDATTAGPYMLHAPLYLRGQTLNRYDFAERSGVWRAINPRTSMRDHHLPREFHPRRTTDQLFYDRVNVEISQQPLNTRSAFSIPPYYATDPDAPVRHLIERWLLVRSDSKLEAARSRVQYRFGTHAFRNGRETSLLRCFAPGEEAYAPGANHQSALFWWRADEQRFESEQLPELAKLAQGVVDAMPPETRQPYAIAKRLNHYLAAEAGLRYTLDLTMHRDQTMDPVEEFLTRNRAGNCQYFAAALALMLRSQGIPSRLVVGYKTAEYSPFGEQYIVRQSHAHAWVEAYLTDTQIPKETILYGQPSGGPAWLRLDPTPAANSFGEGQFTQAVDYAHQLFENFLDTGGETSQDSHLAASGGSLLSPLFSDLVSKLSNAPSGQWDADLSGGTRAIGRWFSLSAAALAAGSIALMLLLSRLRLPWGFRRRGASSGRPAPTQPQLAFFAELCALLETIGCERQLTQTPREYLERAAWALQQPGQRQQSGRPQAAGAMRFLADRYCAIRFGGRPAATAQSHEVRQAMNEIRAAVDGFLSASQPPAPEPPR